MKIILKLGLILVAALTILFFALPQIVDRKANGLYPQATDNNQYPIPDFYSSIDVADLHADTLLWNRNLLEKSDFGHVDVPRMIEGGMALQVFGIVTKVPRGFNIDRNNANTDHITLLTMTQVWPHKTWFQLLERAIYQADKFSHYASESDGKLVLIKGKSDLAAFREKRKNNKSIIAGLLSIEGSHAIAGQLGGLDILYDKGVRILAPTHLFDSEVSGSASGESKGGLTEFGKAWVEKMNEKKLIIDLAHASPQAMNDILTLSKRPVLISHTGVKGTCDNNRNLSDENLRKIADKGGLIGVGFWIFATCGKDIVSIAKAIKHAVRVAGIDHVALGSDFDGAVSTPLTSAQMGYLAGALWQEGLSELEIRKIMSDNLFNFLENNLPD